MNILIIGAVSVIKHFHSLVKTDGKFITITSEAGLTQNSGSHYSAYTVSKMGENKVVAIFRAMKPDYAVYAMHTGRMNTVMGRNDAQIESEETAQSIYRIITGQIIIPEENGWSINYKGEAMTV